MKKIVKIVLPLIFLFALSNSIAQEKKKAPKPGWLVFSQNMVDIVSVSKMNKLTDSVTVPIMKELIDEGILLGWGQLNHAWGDEWNVNFYYITENQTAFVEFWEEFIKRIRERYPAAWNEWAPILKAHKDNMYFVRHMLTTN